jgi:hypothetical protein
VHDDDLGLVSGERITSRAARKQILPTDWLFGYCAIWIAISQSRGRPTASFADTSEHWRRGFHARDRVIVCATSHEYLPRIARRRLRHVENRGRSGVWCDAPLDEGDAG